MDIKSLLLLIKSLLQLQVDYLKVLPEEIGDLIIHRKYKPIFERFSGFFEKAISKHSVEYIRKSYSLLELPGHHKSIDDLKQEIKDLIIEKEQQLSIKTYMIDTIETRVNNVVCLVSLIKDLPNLEEIEYLNYFERCYDLFKHIDHEVRRNLNGIWYRPQLESQLCLENNCEKSLLDKLLNIVDEYKEQIAENCKETFPTEWIVQVNTSSWDQLRWEEISIPVRFDTGKMCIFSDLYFPFYEEGKIEHGTVQLYNILVDENNRFYIGHLIVASTNADERIDYSRNYQIIENMRLKVNPISLEELQRLMYFNEITAEEELWLSEDRIKEIEELFQGKKQYRHRVII